MKKFIVILATLMAMMSCEKTLTVDFTDKKNEIENLEFTNTVTYNGKEYPITKFRIDAEDDGYPYYGYDEPTFDIYCEAKHAISETIVGDYTSYYYEYEAAFIGGYIPTSTLGKMINLNSKDARGVFGFGKSHVVEGHTGNAIIHNVDNTDEFTYGYVNGQKGYFDENANLVNKATPKVVKYYIDIEHTYKEIYKVYIEFEDADSNKYVLSYKGEKKFKD